MKKLVAIKNGRGRVVDYIEMEYSETLKRFVSIPSKEDDKDAEGE